jgi:hypothetical protein
MTCQRDAAAVIFMALVAVSAFLPLGAIAFDWIAIPAAFLVILPALTRCGVLVESFLVDAPSASYFRSLDSRGPPLPALA